MKVNTEGLTKEETKVVEMIANSYIKVMGIEKWNSLTAKEQHDVIMILASDFLKIARA